MEALVSQPMHLSANLPKLTKQNENYEVNIKLPFALL